MRQISFKLYLFLTSIIIFSCSDPSVIGSELLSEDQANLEFSDQIPINGNLINGSIVQTYSEILGLQLFRAHLVGNYEDNLFGKSEASIYTQISLGTQVRPEMDFLQFDSIILSLAYDTLGGGYGDLNQTYGLEVLELEEGMENTSNYDSDQSFSTNPIPIGSIEFTPSPNEPLMIREFISNDTLVSVLPHIRIPLSKDFGEKLLQDTVLYQQDSFLLNIIKGIHIRPTLPSRGILSIDFNQTISRISLYYTSGQTDKVPKEYRFVFNQINARVMNLSHDYEGSMVEQFQKNGADSLLFLQGMTGVNSVLSFPDLANFQNIVVNKAELELTVASTFDQINPTIYPPPEQIIITTGNNGENEVIQDVRSSIIQNNPLNTDIFGGIPIVETQDGTTLTKYKINISGHFQKIIDGEVENSLNLTSGVEDINFYFRIMPKAITPSRVIFYGPNHPLYPLKLNLTYTRL